MIGRPPLSPLFPSTTLFRPRDAVEPLAELESRRDRTVLRYAVPVVQIGRAHVWTPVTLIYLVWRLRFFFFHDRAPTAIPPLPLHDSLPTSRRGRAAGRAGVAPRPDRPALRRPGGTDRKSTRVDSSHTDISCMASSVFFFS